MRKRERETLNRGPIKIEQQANVKVRVEVRRTAKRERKNERKRGIVFLQEREEESELRGWV